MSPLTRLERYGHASLRSTTSETKKKKEKKRKEEAEESPRVNDLARVQTSEFSIAPREIHSGGLSKR